MTCRSPDKEKKYTIIFQEVNPNPFGFEFSADEKYFFICKIFETAQFLKICFNYLLATSSGQDQEGLDQTEAGVCSTHKMRMKIQVHKAGQFDFPNFNYRNFLIHHDNKYTYV